MHQFISIVNSNDNIPSAIDESGLTKAFVNLQQKKRKKERAFVNQMILIKNFKT